MGRRLERVTALVPLLLTGVPHHPPGRTDKHLCRCFGAPFAGVSLNHCPRVPTRERRSTPAAPACRAGGRDAGGRDAGGGGASTRPRVVPRLPGERQASGAAGRAASCEGGRQQRLSHHHSESPNLARPGTGRGGADRVGSRASSVRASAGARTRHCKVDSPPKRRGRSLKPRRRRSSTARRSASCARRCVR